VIEQDSCPWSIHCWCATRHEAPFELGTDGPRSILVGVDGSTTSQRAGWYAAGLARRQRASVTAVYVAPMSARLAVPAAAGAEAAPREADEQTAEDMRRRAEEFSREFGVPIAFRAVRGDPFTELRRVADEIRADAVVGASAHAGHRLIGSLAVRPVKAARWPVTVMP
jgi:nucleotide-binding universal stress UspA family protein